MRKMKRSRLFPVLACQLLVGAAVLLSVAAQPLQAAPDVVDGGRGARQR